MPHESDADWKACQPGEIDELAQRMRRRQRQPIRVQAAAVGAGIILVAGTVLFLGRAADTPGDSHRYGGIHCAEVRQYARTGRLAQLEPGLRRKIDIHRQQCPACDRLLRAMQETQQSHRPPAGAHMVFQRRLPESDCGCSDCRSNVAWHSTAAVGAAPRTSEESGGRLRVLSQIGMPAVYR